MPTRNIPKDEWVTFFESFSRQHEGWLVTLEVLDSDVTTQGELGDEALVSITADLKNPHAEAITAATGSRSKGHFTHIISAPVHVSLKETEEGAHESVRIESKAGKTTLLRFRSAMLPELVDGMV
jgi:hypothetical protein